MNIVYKYFHNNYAVFTKMGIVIKIFKNGVDFYLISAKIENVGKILKILEVKEWF